MARLTQEGRTGFDVLMTEWGGTSFWGHFGFYDIQGNLKAAGQVYFAYMQGNAFIGPPTVQYQDGNVWQYVNIIVDALDGGSLNWNNGNNQAELILSRDGNDTVDTGGGDDVVFGGAGNDTLTGGLGA